MRRLRTAVDRDVHQVLTRHGFSAVDVSIMTAVVNGSIVDSAAEGYADIAQRVASTVAGLLEDYRPAG